MAKACVLAFASFLVSFNALAQFADSAVAYTPGTGVNSNYTNPAAALGEPSRMTSGAFGGPVDPFEPPWQNGQLVAIGAGGSLTLRFDTPITNDLAHPFGLDFIIFGHAGFTITNGDYSGGGITDGSLFGNNTGSSRVSVSDDGLSFYTLNPALAPLVDGFYPTDGSGNFFVPVNPALASRNFAGVGLTGIRALYAGSGGGAGYSIAWAQDTNGNSVSLRSISFVRIEVLSGRAEIDAIAKVAPAAITFTEDFVANPTVHGWRFFGDSDLFHWGAANHNLQVTWDSSRPNSYFQLPLHTVLTRRDDFSVALDLRLSEIAAGIDTNKLGTFQIAFGFQNSVDAEKTNFIRGTGSDSPNLVEFNFFPDTGYGPTVWPAVYSTNSVWNYNGTSDFSLSSLPTGIGMHITLNYTASNSTTAISITTNGIPVGPVTKAKLSPSFTEFRLDTFEIASYSDAGQSPAMPGSILAHGVVDKLVVTFPPPPVQDLRGLLMGSMWQARFLTRTNWLYTLEATRDFQSWTQVAGPQTGTGGEVLLQDTSAALFGARFYRVKALRPD